MSVGIGWFGAVGAVAATLLLAGCGHQPNDSNGVARDAAYGIPAGTMPDEDMQPNGLMINGLLPLPPNSGS